MELYQGLTAPALAPACFAAPSVFAHDSQICQSCPAFDSCSAASLNTLQALRESIDISHLLKRHQNARKVTIEAAQPEENTRASNIKFMPSLKKPTAPVKRRATIVERQVFTIDADVQAIIDNLNQKPAALVHRLAKNGMLEVIKTELSHGRNPYASQERRCFLSVTCEKLLSGGYTKKSLEMALMTALSWKKGTASSHYIIVTPAFVALGIIVEKDGMYVVNPTLTADNE